MAIRQYHSRRRPHNPLWDFVAVFGVLVLVVVVLASIFMFSESSVPQTLPQNDQPVVVPVLPTNTLVPTATSTKIPTPEPTFTALPTVDPFTGWEVIKGEPFEPEKSVPFNVNFLQQRCMAMFFIDDNGKTWTIPLCGQYLVSFSDPKSFIYIEKVNRDWANGRIPRIMLPDTSPSWLKSHFVREERRAYLLVSIERKRNDGGIGFLTTGNVDYLVVYENDDVRQQPVEFGYLDGLRKMYWLDGWQLYALENFQGVVNFPLTKNYFLTYEIQPLAIEREFWKDLHYVFEEKGKIYVFDFPSTFGEKEWHEFYDVSLHYQVRMEPSVRVFTKAP